MIVFGADSFAGFLAGDESVSGWPVRSALYLLDWEIFEADCKHEVEIIVIQNGNSSALRY